MREWAGVEGEEQFSYPSYLILSAQMGGSWIDRPVPPEHRLTLEIDCIRHHLPLPAEQGGGCGKTVQNSTFVVA